jgi:hypothetical protein
VTLMLAALMALAAALNLTSFAPSPVAPVAMSGPFLLLNQSVYNESASVPAWERTDAPGTAGLNPTLVVADDFVVPSGLLTCDGLTVDIGILRAIGSTLRLPARATLWLWDDATPLLGRSFPATVGAALASLTVAVPLEPNAIDWRSDSGGYFVPAAHAQIETLRFRLDNLTGVLLGGPRRYWLGLAIALDRAYNSTDYTQNQPRWMLAAPSISLNGTLAYRVVDAQAPLGAAMYRDVPSLGTWTTADVAEPLVLPFQTAPPLGTVLRSLTRQLALRVIVDTCTGFGRVAALTSVPARYVNAQRQLLFAPHAAAMPAPVGVPVPALAPLPPLPPPPVSPPIATGTETTTPSSWSAAPVPAAASSSSSSSLELALAPTPTNGSAAVVGETHTTLDLVLVILAGIIVIGLIVGLLAIFARRYYRRHYAEQPYEEMLELNEKKPLTDDKVIVALEEGGGGGVTLPRVPYRDGAGTGPGPGLLAPHMGDPPDVRAVKEAHDKNVMVTVPLDAKEEEDDQVVETEK